uniref:K(+) efflux antiporter 5 n=1 Tax=Anthurium amnicola TaxID=1678845 RepID=A0A1D1XXD0_9ARAE
MARADPARGMLPLLLASLAIAAFSPPPPGGVGVGVAARPDKEMRARFWGNLTGTPSPPSSGEGSIADIFDRVLEKEFSENDSPEGSNASSFNSSVADHQAVLETVAIITHDKNDTLAAK